MFSRCHQLDNSALKTQKHPYLVTFTTILSNQPSNGYQQMTHVITDLSFLIPVKKTHDNDPGGRKIRQGHEGRTSALIIFVPS